MKYGYTVELDPQTEVTEDYGNAEDYSYYHETSTTRHLRWIKKGGDDVASELDIPVGEQATVVWYESSTGDSFGYETRYYGEIVGVFRDPDAARAYAKFIEKDYETNHSFGEITFNSPDGQILTFYPPYKGYFEGLDEVHVDTATVEG